MFRRRKTQPEIVDQGPAPTLPDAPAPNADGLRAMTDHRDYLLSLVDPLTPFGMDLLDATGLALCEDITAEVSLPRFDNAQMDGYAVRAADVAGASQGEPVALSVAGKVNAGQDSGVRVESGTAVRIMTGAPLPQGADAVVPFEFTDRGFEGGVVKVREQVGAGEYVRRLGSDITEGEQVASRGQVLDARLVGLLAGAGIDKVLARPRPRVVVISTGAELADPGRPLTSDAQIHDANGYLIAAAAKAAGAQVFRVPAHTDDPDEVREVISDQLIRADLVITTGGVSQGDADVVKQVVPSLGLADFAEVAMQPGKPQGFALVGEDKVPVVMLPGNPVSSYVSFHAFVLPIIRRLMGIEPESHEPVRAVAETVMRSVKGKLQLGRGIVSDDNGRLTVRLVGGHGSHLLGDLARSNALVLLPDDVEKVAAGDVVRCWLLGNG